MLGHQQAHAEVAHHFLCRGAPAFLAVSDVDEFSSIRQVGRWDICGMADLVAALGCLPGNEAPGGLQGNELGGLGFMQARGFGGVTERFAAPRFDVCLTGLRLLQNPRQLIAKDGEGFLVLRAWPADPGHVPAVDPVSAFAGDRLTIRGLELQLQTLQHLSFLAPLLLQRLVRFKCLVFEFLLRPKIPLQARDSLIDAVHFLLKHPHVDAPEVVLHRRCRAGFRQGCGSRRMHGT